MLYESDDDLEDHEFPEEDDDDGDLLPCPNCRQLIFDDVPQCHYCGEYITHSSSPFAGRPSWWIGIGILGIVSVVLLLLFGRG